MGAAETKQCIVVRKDLAMDAGKLGSQVAHAAMAFLINYKNRYILQHVDSDENEYWLKVKLNEATRDWLDYSFTKIVLECSGEEELLQLVNVATEDGITVHPIVDNGTTVFGKPTLTCAAFGPDFSYVLDKHLRHLKLYSTRPYVPVYKPLVSDKEAQDIADHMSAFMKRQHG